MDFIKLRRAGLHLKRFKIFSLFGLFDHDIPFNEEGITIIHAPNGYGKTAVLRIINGFFNGNFLILRQIPFKSAHFYFDSDIEIVIRQIEPPKEKVITRTIDEDLRLSTLEFTRIENNKISKPWIPRLRENDFNFPLSIVDRSIAELDRIDSQMWRNTETGESLNLYEVINRYGDRLPPDVGQLRFPDWLRQAHDEIPCRLIETQRLLPLQERPPNRYERDASRKLTPAVRTQAVHMIATIKQLLADSGTFSQSLDRTFPRRLIDVPPNLHPFAIRVGR
jgi:hypothetical protein